MSAVDDLLAEHPSPRWGPIVWASIALIVAGIGWAAVTELDEVASASGEVVPQGKVKVVQHYEGGMIAELYVQEGSVVAEGEPLLQLDLSASGANREELQVRLDALLIARARLLAEANGSPVEFPPEPARRRPDLVAAEQQNYRARTEQQTSAVEALKALVRQRELEIRQLRERQRTIGGDLRLARERMRMSSELVEKSLTSKLDHLAVQREYEMLEGEVAGLAIQVPRAQAALEETQLRLKEQEARFRRDALEELAKNEPQMDRIREQLVISTDQVRRTKVLSPTDGVVKDLRYTTIGGVVRPGEPIMQVVPTQATLVVEARLMPADRGYVRVGQPAQVKVTAYDFYRYGALEGRVTGIAADSTVGQDGVAFFKLMVETGRNYFGEERDALPITAGMQTSVDVHTGTRTVMEFLLKPVLRIRYEGFRER
ncbi:HlyD family type I secretion periplasmic adaptor subunit [Desertibaculum subflavum]|uniref:HlyD family type I secretion periplasmic adaptor subunit n=1 Tax=Desertibaculum subflavum TaxID=2268458 RepID=UPI000E66EAEF